MLSQSAKHYSFSGSRTEYFITKRREERKLEISSMPWNFHVCHLHQADERLSYSFHPIHWLVIEYEAVCERRGRALGRRWRRRKANCDLWWFGFDMCDDESWLCKTSLKMGQQKWEISIHFVNLSSGVMRPRVICKDSIKKSSNLQQTLHFDDQFKPDLPNTRKPRSQNPQTTPASSLKILGVSLLTKALIVNILESRNRK